MKKQQTRMITVRQLRQNLSQYLREAEEKRVHFVVLRHAVPVAHVVPIKRRTKKGGGMEELLRDLKEAQAQYNRGERYTSDEVRTMLGL